MPSVCDQVEEVELMGGGQSARVVGIDGRVRLGATEVEGHAQRPLRIGEALHGEADFLAALGELALELRGERGVALAIEIARTPAAPGASAPQASAAGDRQYRQRE